MTCDGIGDGRLREQPMGSIRDDRQHLTLSAKYDASNSSGGRSNSRSSSRWRGQIKHARVHHSRSRSTNGVDRKHHGADRSHGEW